MGCGLEMKMVLQIALDQVLWRTSLSTLHSVHGHPRVGPAGGTLDLVLEIAVEPCRTRSYRGSPSVGERRALADAMEFGVRSQQALALRETVEVALSRVMGSERLENCSSAVSTAEDR